MARGSPAAGVRARPSSVLSELMHSSACGGAGQRQSLLVCEGEMSTGLCFPSSIKITRQMMRRDTDEVSLDDGRVVRVMVSQ